MKQIAIGVVAGGIAGTILNSVAAGLLFGADTFGLLFAPGRYAVAILCAAALPLLYRTLSESVAHIIGIAFLVIAPSLLARYVFGAAAPWLVILGLNAVYALAAWAVYVAVALPGTGGQSQSGLTTRIL